MGKQTNLALIFISPRLSWVTFYSFLINFCGIFSSRHLRQFPQLTHVSLCEGVDRRHLASSSSSSSSAGGGGEVGPVGGGGGAPIVGRRGVALLPPPPPVVHHRLGLGDPGADGVLEKKVGCFYSFFKKKTLFK